MEERWLPCNDEDVYNYEVSDHGRIRNPRTGKILNTYINDKGYEVVCLTNNGRQYVKKIHILVAKTFCGYRPYGYEAYHLDCDKLKNVADNIAWGSRSDVIKNAYRNGRLKPYRCKRIRVVETGKVYSSIGECSNDISLNPSTISKCLNYPDIYNNRYGYHFETLD